MRVLQRVGIGLIVLLGLWSSPARAQGDIDVTGIYWWSGIGGTQRFKMSTGSGAPSGGTTGDWYLDYATGEVYTRRNTGSWTLLIRAEDTNTFPVVQTFTAGITLGTSGNLFGGTNTVEQYNATSAQRFNIYNTRTSATNNEYGYLWWNSNFFRLGTDAGSGGGTDRDILIEPGNATALTLAAGTLSATFAAAVAVTGNFAVATTKLTVNATTALTTINGNTATLPAPLTGTLLHVGAADGTNTRLEVDAFATNAQLILRRANTTAASPSALASADIIGRLGGSGYGATGYATGNRAYVEFGTTQTWTDSAQGAYLGLATTPNGSTTSAERVRIHQSGGVSIGTTTTDPGANVLGVTSDILPFTNYTSNAGSISKKFLAIHGAELQVETLVAASTMATIGGRVLVAPTTTLTSDKAEMIATPGAPTVTPQGVSGATTYSYKITALDGQGETIASSAGQTTTGNATLTGSNFNRVTWSAVTGATRYHIYGRSSGSWNIMGASATTTFDDTGGGIGGIAAPAVGVSTFFVKANTFAVDAQPYMESNGKVEWLLVGRWNITAVNTGAKQFGILGEYAGIFTAGRTFVIVGSTGNDGTYTISTASTSSFQTTITVVEAIPSATADGGVSYVNTGTNTGYGYKMTRDRDGTGTNQWYAGDALLSTGTTGDGYIDLFSVSGVLSGAGPTIVGNLRTGTLYNSIVPRWVIGNLNGLYNYGATTFGACFGDSTATNVCIEATNGVRIRHGTNDKLVAGTSGTLTLTGDFVMSTSGVIRAGATAFGSGTGLYYDFNGGTPRFRVGNPSGAKLQWDGSTLTAAGWTMNTSTITGGNATLDSAGVLTLGTSNDVSILSAADSTYRLWVGHATASSAPFRVTKAGAATLTSVTINAGNVVLDSNGITIGGTPSGASAASAYNFTRPTGLGFGQSGDIFSMWFSSVSGLDEIGIQNKIVGNGTSDGTSRVVLKAQGWENNAGGSSTTEASIILTSSPSTMQIDLTAPVINFDGSTRVAVTSALFRVTNAAANLEVTNGTTTMSTQPGFFGTTSNHAWIVLTNNGTNSTFCAAGGGTTGAPTGGCKGSGTWNFAGDIYKNNSAYGNPKWVLQHFYTGSGDQSGPYEMPAWYQGLRSIDEHRAFVSTHFDLPLMLQEQDAGVFRRGELLMASVEEAYLYIYQLHDRITAQDARIAALEQREHERALANQGIVRKGGGR